ncbi:MAG: prenyltransferase/squalene oxidase repeat-containing protein [Candidatus Bathyarchaeia archaeon]
MNVSYNPINNPSHQDLNIYLYIKATDIEGSTVETGIKVPVTVTHQQGPTPPSGLTFPLSPNDTPIVKALNYLRSVQGANGEIGGFGISCWATMAIASAGQKPIEWMKDGKSIVDYLVYNRNQVDDRKTTDIAKFVLAIVAAGGNPRNVNGSDYVRRLEAKYMSGQFGDQSTHNDDFWAIMALISAGADPNSEHIRNTITFIKSRQNSDGGWSWTIGGSSDVDDTAAAILSLIAAGEPKNSPTIINGLNYLKSQLSPNGGFMFQGTANSASDSWAIMALTAAGVDVEGADWVKNGVSPFDHLLSLQNPDGSFNWAEGQNPSAWWTAYAVPALLGKKYPIAPPANSTTAQVYIRIEDLSSTIWRGWIDLPASVMVRAYNSGRNYTISGDNVLAVLHEASKLGGFSYRVSDQWYPAMGFYVESIGDHSAQGSYGWLFRINYFLPNVSMDKCKVERSDNILVYWGTLGVKPIKLEVYPAEVPINQSFTVSVKYLDDDYKRWIPLPQATVHVNPDFITDSNGAVSVRLSRPGVYNVYAEKWGVSPQDQFVRSDKVQVGVGVPIPEFYPQTTILMSTLLIVALLVVLKISKKHRCM